MGVFWATMDVGDPAGQRFESVEALVDTGASYTSLPASLLERLGVKREDRMAFVLADGRKHEKDIGQTWVRVDDKRVITIVIFGEDEAPALLGAYTLEGVRLAADPVNKRLMPTPAYLVSQWPSEESS
jgi:aspartyl protease family protein